MRLNTIQRKKARRGFEQALGKEDLVNRMYQIIKRGLHHDGYFGIIQFLDNSLGASTFGGEVDGPDRLKGRVFLGMDWRNASKKSGH